MVTVVMREQQRSCEMPLTLLCTLSPFHTWQISKVSNKHLRANIHSLYFQKIVVLHHLTHSISQWTKWNDLPITTSKNIYIGILLNYKIPYQVDLSWALSLLARSTKTSYKILLGLKWFPSMKPRSVMKGSTPNVI